ncbi:hypothetical protein BXU06_13610 [Aquaspirillum sp. LM1]|nr:hypothetical protein BXU06_13610 [Aquaspirillum sp. LM1]
MNKFHLNIPDNLNDKSLIKFFCGWRWHADPVAPIEVNFKGCNFIAPYAVTLFAIYLLWLKEAKRKSVRIHVTESSVAGNYLVETGFLEIINKKPNLENVEQSNRTVKLTRIKSSAEIPAFAAKVMEILHIEDEELEGAVKYSLIELLRNIVQHSGSSVGGIAMAQYYPNSGLVNICVADMGVGLKDSLTEAYPELNTDLQALKLATMPHVSRTFGPETYSTMRDNAGLGLFFIKQIASLANGSFFLGSKNALMDLWGDEKGTQKKTYQTAKNGGWPGTFAYLQLRRDSIAEFNEILTVCRNMAAEARKYPAELALDFIEEVPDEPGLIVVNVVDFEENVEEASKFRETIILPSINSGAMVVLNFNKVRFATQSFVHALMYKVIRDGQQIGSTLSIANCTNATREAIMAVAAYAKTTPHELA